MIAIEPLHGVFHRGGLEHAAHGASGLGPCDKPGVAQHVEMLHDGGQRHRERLGQFADRQTIVVAQPRQQRPPGGVGKRSKGAIEGGITILNHIVKYSNCGRNVNGSCRHKTNIGMLGFKPPLTVRDR